MSQLKLALAQTRLGETMFTIMNVYLAALINGSLQAMVLLFNRKGNLVANRLLACLIMLLMLSLWNIIVGYSGSPAYWKLIDFNNWITPFFWGPVLYFYVLASANTRDFRLINLAKHLALGVAIFGIDLALSALTKANGMPQHYETFNNLRLLSFYVQMAVYIFASYQQLRSYDEKLRNNFSSIDSINLDWLQKLVAVFAVVLAVDMGLIVPAILGQKPIPYFDVIMLAEAAAVFAIGYFSMIHSGVLLHSDGDKSKAKYQGSPVDSEMSVNLMNKLETVMGERQSYLNNELRLSDLASLVDVSPHYLSQVINEQGQRNFYDYVNEYRAKHAAQLLSADEKANITRVAFDAGFNNRVSFNNAFKKHMGMTPSQYRSSKNGTDYQSVQQDA